MDILLYAAQKRQADLIQANNNLAATCTACKCTACRENYDTAYKQYCDTYYIPCTQLAYSCGYNNTAISFCGFSPAFWASSKSAEVACYNKCQQVILCNPWDTALWARIPRLSNSANTSDPGTGVTGLQVCSTNLYGGACCLFTVPSGLSLIRFQIWGPGGRNGSGCCCGGSPHGTTGAYASIIIPAIAGCQYTLCAGCACGTPILWGANSPNNTTDGSPSLVTGFGLCNFCARAGAGPNLWCRMAYDYKGFQYSGCCLWTSGDCWASGGCICNSGSDFCSTSSCASCGCIPFMCSNRTSYFGCYNGPLTAAACFAYAGVIAGIPGLHGSHCYDTNLYGHACHPPIYGFETVSQCIICHNNGNSFGGILCNHADNNYMRYPGAGATASIMMAGCQMPCTTSATSLICAGASRACGGDIGRSGMVCVSYC